MCCFSFAQDCPFPLWCPNLCWPSDAGNLPGIRGWSPSRYYVELSRHRALLPDGHINC